MKGSYFGSVRFYKNLILAVIVVLISLGFGLSIHFHHSLKKTQKDLDSLKAATSQFLSEDGSFSVPSGEGPDYQMLYPDFYAPEAPVTIPEEDQTVYLTFNGALTQETANILDTLREKGIKATFFVTGSEQPEARSILQRIVDEGHTVGLLSWSEDYASIYQSVDAYLADMYRLFTYVQETVGITPSIFRFLGGSVNSYNAGLYQELIAEMLRRGFVPFDWNVTSQDAVLDTPEEVALRVTSLTESLQRSIVLFHSTSPLASIAIDSAANTLQSAGYVFAPLSEHVKPILFSY